MKQKDRFYSIKKKAARGALTLTARRIILKGIDALGMIFLARLLTQSEFGIFGIINFVVFTLFGFLSDIGLGASLIQRKKINRRDLTTVFSVQFILVLFLNFLVWLFSPLLIKLYHLSHASVWLMRATAFCLILTSFKTIPSVLLERELKYEKLLIPEIAETVIFNFLAVILAYFGFGVWSLTVGLLARTAVGAFILFLMVPWPIGLRISRSSLKHLLGFGIPYQANSLLALLKDNLTPTVIAYFYGPAAVGYVNLAQGIAYKPMEISNIINRLVFPTFSKIQEDRVRVGRWFERGVRLMGYFYFPLVFGLLVVARPILTYVYAAKSDKWLPALPALYPFIIGSLPVIFTTTGSNVLYALGRSKSVLKLMVIYTLLTWAIGIPLIVKIGYVGIAWAGVPIALISIFLVKNEMKKVGIKFSFTRMLGVPFLASFFMAFLIYWPAQYWVKNIVHLLLVIISGIFAYIFFLFLLLRGKMKEELEIIVNSVSGRRKKLS